MSMPVQQRLRQALRESEQRLVQAGIASAAAESRTLVQAAAGTERHLVLIDDLPKEFEEDLDRMLQRRCAREPLQLILGYVPFRRLQLEVQAGVFVPRPETELLIDLLREHAEGEVHRVVDLCTGSGAIAAAVLDEMPEVMVRAVEIDEKAAQLAERNMARAAGDRGEGRGRVLHADVTDPQLVPTLLPTWAGSVDAVLSNPPYIPANAVPRDVEVREHDPHRALYGGGEDGLDVPAAVIARARDLLRPGGLLLMEHADVQGEATRRLAENGGLQDAQTLKDLTGRDRFLLARRGEEAQPPQEVRD